MMRVLLTERAQEDLRRIDREHARRILKKLFFFARQTHPLRFAKRITDPRLGTYRFRVGDYRILFDTRHDGTIEILLILTVKRSPSVRSGLQTLLGLSERGTPYSPDKRRDWCGVKHRRKAYLL